MSDAELTVNINLTLDATRASASAVPPLPRLPLMSPLPQQMSQQIPTNTILADAATENMNEADPQSAQSPQSPQSPGGIKTILPRYIVKHGPGNLTSRYDRETQQWS